MLARFIESPRCWVTLAALFVALSITFFRYDISLVFVGVAAVCAYAVLVVSTHRDKEKERDWLAPIKKFEEDLRRCEPAEAAWLRLHHKATFDESWVQPVHPVAQEVINSLKPKQPKQILKDSITDRRKYPTVDEFTSAVIEQMDKDILAIQGMTGSRMMSREQALDTLFLL